MNVEPHWRGGVICVGRGDQARQDRANEIPGLTAVAVLEFADRSRQVGDDLAAKALRIRRHLHNPAAAGFFVEERNGLLRGALVGRQRGDSGGDICEVAGAAPCLDELHEARDRAGGACRCLLQLAPLRRPCVGNPAYRVEKGLGEGAQGGRVQKVILQGRERSGLDAAIIEPPAVAAGTEIQLAAAAHHLALLDDVVFAAASALDHGGKQSFALARPPGGGAADLLLSTARGAPGIGVDDGEIGRLDAQPVAFVLDLMNALAALRIAAHAGPAEDNLAAIDRIFENADAALAVAVDGVRTP